MKLTVTDDALEDSMLKGISGSSPTILSNLKTMLETGHPRPKTPMAH